MTALRMTGENHRLCGQANGDFRRINWRPVNRCGRSRSREVMERASVDIEISLDLQREQVLDREPLGAMSFDRETPAPLIGDALQLCAHCPANL